MNLDKYLKARNQKLKILPSFHTTNFISFFKIIEEKKIQPRYCEKLEGIFTYYFYGKASYAYGNDSIAQSDFDSLPVCFIIDTSKLMIERIYPFDSGGYITNRFDGAIKHNFEIEEFGIGNNIDSLGSYIETFFQNNSNYLKGICKFNTQIMPSEFLLASLVTLLTNKHQSSFDDRSRTVEIVSSNQLELRNALLGVIVPESICLELENPYLDLLKEVRTFYYNDSTPYNLREMIGKVKEYAYEFTKDKDGEFGYDK